ncbi:MAG TPA: hydantoinase B/oxoprolinase family protein [Candidatus Binataceae bacterium]|nr:hydantoinase B/oxoprolinase family protein [Candidatus Binataceae bacterium]
MERKFDPILVQVIKNELATVNEEMAIAVYRTGRSAMVKVGDFATAVCDARGRVVGEGAAPFQIGIFMVVLETILRDFGGTFRPGDVILVNDPYSGMGHLPDVAIVAPAFWRDALIGFTLAYSHHTDIGGRFPGGFSSQCTEAYEEGLRIPPIKLDDGGVRNLALLQMIEANVRAPEEWIGDVEAKIAGCRRGELELRALVEKYGLEIFNSSCDYFVEYAETATRAAIRTIVPGEYVFEDSFEDDGLGGAEVAMPLRVALRVDDDTLTVDFSGTAPQARAAINMPFGMTRGTVYGAIKSIVSPDVLTNVGFTRPISIIAPEGTLVNPRMPAAVGGRAPLFFRVFDMMFRVLAQALPDKVGISGEGGDVLHFSGTKPDGSHFSFMDLFFGGWGGRPTKDGIDGVAPMSFGSYGSVPAEVLEREFPVVVDGFGYVADTEGAGKHRGSLGIYKQWRFLQPGKVMVRTNRLVRPSDGLAGGHAGELSANILNSREGRRPLPRQSHIHLDVERGDRIYHRVSGSGGFGEPAARDPNLVVLDVREGKVSIEQARERYKVVIDPDRMTLDNLATEKLRDQTHPA